MRQYPSGVVFIRWKPTPSGWCGES